MGRQHPFVQRSSFRSPQGKSLPLGTGSRRYSGTPQGGGSMSLLDFQRRMAEDVSRPLTIKFAMQTVSTDGSSVAEIIASYVKPNDRLSSFERLEIYNRQYWFRVLDCLYDDYPGLRAVVGERRFMNLARAY